MAFPILPVTIDDLPTLVDNLYASNFELTINHLLWKDWPNELCQRASHKNAFGNNIGKEGSEIWKVLDGEEVVGQMVVNRRLAKEKDEEREKKEREEKMNGPGKLEGINPVVLEEVMRFVKAVDTVGGIEHLELTHIYVRPTYRRKGIGSQLIKLAISSAEKAGIPLAGGIESRAYPFLLAQGFKVTKYEDVDLTKFAPEPHTGFGNFRFYEMKYEGEVKNPA